MAVEWTLGKPVQLLDPLDREPPNPVKGCDVCEALVRQWAAATNSKSPAYDPSKASDLVVEMNRHHHASGAE